MQDAHSFLSTFQKVQLGIMADEILDVGFGSLTYSLTDRSVYFNNILIDQLLTYEQVNSAEKMWQSKKRASTFYFEQTPRLENLKSFLIEKGYTQSFEDCWMFHSGKNINSTRFTEVKKVETNEDLEIFIKTFDQSFQKDDPQNPYGTIGEGLEIARKAWLNFRGQNKLHYFIAFKDGSPVAVSALTNYQDHGYISNVGSLRSVRGQGYGKLVTLYSVDQSLKNGNSLHYLATEEGHYPNAFYTQIGFETKYKAVGWTKKLV